MVVRAVLPDPGCAAAAQALVDAASPGIKQYTLENIRDGSIGPQAVDTYEDTRKIFNGDWCKPKLQHYCIRCSEDRRSENH